MRWKTTRRVLWRGGHWEGTGSTTINCALARHLQGTPVISAKRRTRKMRKTFVSQSKVMCARTDSAIHASTTTSQKLRRKRILISLVSLPRAMSYLPTATSGSKMVTTLARCAWASASVQPAWETKTTTRIGTTRYWKTWTRTKLMPFILIIASRLACLKGMPIINGASRIQIECLLKAHRTWQWLATIKLQARASMPRC